MSESLSVKECALDFSECSYIGEVYAVIKKELELPEWCGSNINAFWDALTGIMYVPAEITVSKKVANKELDSVVAQIIEVMYEAEQTYHEIKVIEIL